MLRIFGLVIIRTATYDSLVDSLRSCREGWTAASWRYVAALSTTVEDFSVPVPRPDQCPIRVHRRCSRDAGHHGAHIG